MKYYAIKNGRKTGIFETWDECKKYVIGYKNAIYKSFLTLEEANNFLNDQPLKEINYDLPTFYVDGSYDINSGAYSYGGILLIDGKEDFKFNKAFDCDEFSISRNVSGEIFGAMFAINIALGREYKEINICYDYIGIEMWYKSLWKANTDIALMYANFRDEIKDKIKINFIKIKSHTNNKYNDLADCLAKEALGI